MQQPLTMELLQRNLEILARIFNSVRIVDPLKNRVLAMVENKLEESGHTCFAVWKRNTLCGNCIAIRAFREKEPFFKLEYSNKKVYMIIAVPVDADGHPIVLELINDVTSSIVVGELLPEENSALLGILSQINQLQIKDPLTCIFNRRYLEERLPVDILNCSAENKPFTILLADIDRFKLVNDHYGHVAGDFVLKEFAGRLQSTVEIHGGWAARYGGEEFLISLPGKTQVEGIQLAEELRKAVEANEIFHRNRLLKITSSFGVSSLEEAARDTLESLIERADRNLYRAKSSGRNQVVGD